MATIIDALLVTLGLDTSGYKQGAKEAEKAGKQLAESQEAATKKVTESTKKASAEQVAQMKKAEDAARKLADGYAKARTELIEMAAGVLTSTGLGTFIAKTVGGMEQLSYASKNLDMSARSLDAWHLAVQKLGGTDTDFDKFAARVKKFKADYGQSQLDLEDRQFEATLGQQFKVNPESLKAGDVNAVMQQIAKSQQGMSALDSSTNLRRLGLDDSMVRLLQQGADGVQALYNEEYKLSTVTDENAEKAAKAEQTWRQFKNTLSEIGVTLASDLEPGLEQVNKLLDRFGKWASANPHAAAAVGLGTSVATAAVGTTAITGAVRALFGGVGAAAGAGGSAAPVVAAGAGGWTLGSLIRPYYDEYVRKASGGDRWSLNDFLTGTHRLELKGTGGYTQDELNSVKTDGGAKLSADAQRRLAAAHDLKESATAQRSASKALDDSAKAQRESTKVLVEAVKDLAGALSTNANASEMSPIGDVTSGNVKQAVAAFVQMGWTKEQASGIVANLNIESGLRPNISGDNGAAYGVAQWHADRQAEFKRVFGKDIRGSSLAEQLQFVNYELTKGQEAPAGRALRGAKSAAEAGGIVSSRYERPLKVQEEIAKRSAAASSLYASMGNIPSLAPMYEATARAQAGSMTTNNNSSETHIGQITVVSPNTHDGKKVVADMKDAINRNGLVLGASYGVS